MIWAVHEAMTSVRLRRPVEACFTDVRVIRGSGGATDERSLYVPMVSPLYAADNMLKPRVFCVQELAVPQWGWRRRLHNTTTAGETAFAMVVDRGGRAVHGDEQLTGNEAQTQRYGGGVR